MPPGMNDEPSFDVPRETILPVTNCRLRLDPSPHPFETMNREAIAENWRREKAAKPALFDGMAVLLSRLAYSDGLLDGLCHAARYSTFMLWRQRRPVAGAQHIYAQAVPVGADGALLAVRMGGHTANPGKVYFASGSFEPPDEFPDGIADVQGNMARELAEETGLDLFAGHPAGPLHMLWRETGVVLFRRHVFDETAAVLAERVKTFVAADPDPEIEGPVVISGPEDLPARLQDHMPPIIDWHFSTPLKA
jgi:8-oxo-dGTP pyrophosphatase MutT (NUDIX family)